MNKANPDYSASAVNLTNPPELAELLQEWRGSQRYLSQLNDTAKALIPDDLKAQIQIVGETVKVLGERIRGFIDRLGSYQDTDAGFYAVKQRRESIIYSVSATKAILDPKLAALVIVETVDSKAIEVLVKGGKGGLITAQQARDCGEVKEAYAYVIR